MIISSRWSALHQGQRLLQRTEQFVWLFNICVIINVTTFGKIYQKSSFFKKDTALLPITMKFTNIYQQHNTKFKKKKLTLAEQSNWLRLMHNRDKDKFPPSFALLIHQQFSPFILCNEQCTYYGDEDKLAVVLFNWHHDS